MKSCLPQSFQSDTAHGMCRSIEGLPHEKTMSFMEFWISSNKNVGPGFFKILGLKL